MCILFINLLHSKSRPIYLSVKNSITPMAYYSKNTNEYLTFTSALLSKRYRKAQNDFLNQIDTLIDWRPIRTLINKKYTKQQNAIGVPAYDVILLFKMMLLETWYNLSDCTLEERINDSITFSRFLGLKMEEVSRDHSTISRFCSALNGVGSHGQTIGAV